jgi:hypothetical protein
LWGRSRFGWPESERFATFRVWEGGGGREGWKGTRVGGGGGGGGGGV